MDGQSASLSLAYIVGRSALLHKPCKTITHARLASFVPREARDNAILDYAADTGDITLLCAQQHVAIGGTHDDDHLFRFKDSSYWHRNMGIYISHGHGR